MNNKEKIKKSINNDFSKDGNYNKIMEKIEMGENMKKNSIWKWSLVPICLVAIIGGILFIKSKNNNGIILDNYIDKENNVNLNINDLKNVGAALLDADVNVVQNSDVDFPLPYKNGLVDIPKDLDSISKYIFYFRENKDSKDYNILGYYEIIYYNGNDRTIKVSYSKNGKPARDYRFSDEGSKTTIINDVELKVFKYEEIYFTEFKYNDYNFDIETSNITDQELSNLLVSIIK